MLGKPVSSLGAVPYAPSGQLGDSTSYGVGVINVSTLHIQTQGVTYNSTDTSGYGL